MILGNMKENKYETLKPANDWTRTSYMDDDADTILLVGVLVLEVLDCIRDSRIEQGHRSLCLVMRISESKTDIDSD